MLNFLHRNSHQRDYKSETNIFIWVWLGKERSPKANFDDPGVELDLNGLEKESFIYFLHKNLSYITKLILTHRIAELFDR